MTFSYLNDFCKPVLPAKNMFKVMRAFHFNILQLWERYFCMFSEVVTFKTCKTNVQLKRFRKQKCSIDNVLIMFLC